MTPNEPASSEARATTKKPAGWLAKITKAEKTLSKEQSERGIRYIRTYLPNKRDAHFGFDLKQSSETSGISFRFLIQEHLKNGATGVIKYAEVDHASIPLFHEEQDREVLLTLLGKTQVGGRPYYSGGGNHIVNVPLEYADEVFRAVSATKKMHLIKDANPYSYARNERFVLEPFHYASHRWFLELELTCEDDHFLLSASFTDGTSNRNPRDLLKRIGPFLFFNDFAALSSIQSSLAWAEVFKSGQNIVIPEDEVNSFLEYYFDSGTATKIKVPAEFAMKEASSVSPGCRLTIATVEESFHHLQADVEFVYGSKSIPTDFSGDRLFDIPKREFILRKVDAEAEILSRFQSLNPQSNFGRMQDLDTDGIFNQRELSSIVEQALTFGWEVVALAKNVRAPKDFSISATSGIDWFDINTEFNFEGFTASLPQLLAAIKSGQRIVQLGDGSCGMLPIEWLKKFGPIAEVGTETEDGLRLNKVQALFLSASFEDNEKFQGDRKFNSLKSIVGDFNNLKTSEPDKSFVGSLRTYQKEGLAWLKTLAKHEIGGILADDMGLGKTIQILALLSEKKLMREEHLPNLIVAPKSLIFNWVKEAEKFTPHLKVLNYTGTTRTEQLKNFDEFDIVLTTYQSL